MRLRKWQSKCVKAALEHFKLQSKHFFALATPGAGKSIMAAELVTQLFQQNMIDLVLCLSPSAEVRDGISRTFKLHRPDIFHDGIGSVVVSMTYQKLLTLDDEFLKPALNKRLFVILDEAHHCSGGGESIPNAWGSKVLNQILAYANYTLSLSGTPWRTDKLPIALAKYCVNDSLIVNYQYGLAQAISDGVCRRPIVTLIDNDICNINHKTYASISDALSKTELMYKHIVEDPAALKHILKLSITKLNSIRSKTPDAAGLVVAYSIEHARKIKQLLEIEFGQTADIVTYREKHAQQIIKNFRHGNAQWIVSVGMIAEGTDIPRLHVCCHITTVRTELYFRQILGRIMRVRSTDNAKECYLFTFAEPELKRFADNIQTELPDYKVVYNTTHSTGKTCEIHGEIVRGNYGLIGSNDGSLYEKQTKTQTDTSNENTFTWYFRGDFREHVINSFSQI